MSEFTKADFDALFRAFFDAKPMTEAERDAAKAAMDKMSPWQTMTFKELDDICAEEEKARNSPPSKGNA